MQRRVGLHARTVAAFGHVLHGCFHHHGEAFQASGACKFPLETLPAHASMAAQKIVQALALDCAAVNQPDKAIVARWDGPGLHFAVIAAKGERRLFPGVSDDLHCSRPPMYPASSARPSRAACAASWGIVAVQVRVNPSPAFFVRRAP